MKLKTASGMLSMRDTKKGKGRQVELHHACARSGRTLANPDAFSGFAKVSPAEAMCAINVLDPKKPPK